MKLRPGIYAAQIVPYDAEGRVKTKELAALVERSVVRGRMDGLYIGGSTGENFLNDAEAKRAVLETCAAAAAAASAKLGGPKVSLIAQIGSLNVREAESLGKLAAGLGYDAVSAVTPYYYKFSFAETREYYVRLAEAAGLPMLVYSVPALTGTSFDLDQTKKLYEHPLVAGFKYTSGDLFTMERLVKAFPDRLVFSGYDELLLCGRALGAYGAIGSTYNLFAPLARRVWEATGEGRLAEAREAQGELNDAIQELASLGLYQAIKEILAAEGIEAGDCLPPFGKLQPEAREKARNLGKRFADKGISIPRAGA
ncbi:MAG: N-acetylneuraminate lyase [Spirochaetaceae bacterium]|nr:N-acetylneuraminate lyase [Spirochaetaceae bacterium]